MACKDNVDMMLYKKFELKSIQSIIREANLIYGKRFETGDRTWYFERYCKDACAMPEGMESVCGIDSIIQYYYNDGKNKDFKIVISEKEIYGVQDLVVEEGIYDFPDGNGGSFDKGKFIAIWKTEDGHWKIYREIWNSNLKHPAN
ncbi:MAG: nuclear transport factor 2 family protein [Saprospiraceae bacterium]|nr:nuclear transport factor 2 family protein [Saprospiraceae bacterium]